ncbi:MAG: ATP phosphoribosyltransferase regulatory subunit [Gammaproteobacteria bacterium]|nr:ATP phosphoribosyltransferase regulatory subunit [Gammaproteobacteria bacterium]
MNNDHWLLPEGIEELLPEDAQQIEWMRRRLLDFFSTWGYELVIPPFVEYIESLLTGMGNDLELQTYKLIDQKNGRMMGVRADMTPQVARIDAHQLARPHPVRLCYIGTVLLTHAEDLSNARSLMQIGAELFGHAGLESDVETLSLMLAMLKKIGIENIYVDLGHVGIFRGLTKQARLNEVQEGALFDALQRKAAPEIDVLLQKFDIGQNMKNMLSQLMWLNGSRDVLPQARDTLKSADQSVHEAIDALENISLQVQKYNPDIQVNYDLAELRGYHYHTGMVFAAYQPGVGQAIAKGGRYDHIGEVFGRARPASGFSADLRALMHFATNSSRQIFGVYAPADQDDGLQTRIDELRQSGERVVRQLPGQIGDAAAMVCDRRLEKHNGRWIVTTIG